jgi:glycosyltransferase involved in cell wall biosynthesis
LKYIRNAENLGLFGNFNRCIEVAGGDYIHILHSDDYIDPDFTEKCISFFQTHPDVAMTFTSTCVLKNNNPPVECVLFDENTVFKAPEGFRRILTKRPFISCPSVIVRRSIYQKNGNFPLEYSYSADYYMWLQIAKLHDIAYIKDARLVYRQGEHSESFRLLFSSPDGYLDLIKILIRVKTELGGEEALFTPDLNSAARRHMNDCLFAGITRSKTMRNVSPSLFIGFAFIAWTLVRPVVLRDWLKKTGDLVRIVGIWTVILLPGGRTLLEKIFRLDPQKY